MLPLVILTLIARGLVILIAMYPAWWWGWLLGALVAGESGAGIGSWIALSLSSCGWGGRSQGGTEERMILRRDRQFTNSVLNIDSSTSALG